MAFINPQPDIDRRVFLNPDTARFQPSVIRQMTLRADDTPGAINLSQGMPNKQFEVPAFVRAAAHAAIDGEFNQYAPPVGLLSLRTAVAKHSAPTLGYHPDPATEVSVTCGATEAVYVALRCLTQPGDRVVLFTPSYENYWADALLMNITPVLVRLRAPDWRVDLDELRAAFRPGPGEAPPRAIVMCNPNNPTGTVFTEAELAAIAEECVRCNAAAVVDEVYEHIVYDGLEHRSLASFPGMRDRTVTVSSASKTFSVTGWRIGTVVAEPGISAAIRRVHDFVTITAPAPLQQAVADSYEVAGRGGYYDVFLSEYTARRELLFRELRELRDTGLEVTKPEGAYYLMADISALADSDRTFSDRLLAEAGVATVPASCFFDATDQAAGRRYVRFCYCKTDDLLTGAASRLARWGRGRRR